ADVLGDVEGVVVQPGDVGGRGGTVGGDVLRLGSGRNAGCGNDVDVAAGRALIAHQAADEGDLLAVGREAGDGDLEAVEVAGDFLRVEDGLWCTVGHTEASA